MTTQNEQGNPQNFITNSKDSVFLQDQFIVRKMLKTKLFHSHFGINQKYKNRNIYFGKCRLYINRNIVPGEK